jgi:hypothetical protein
MNNALDRFLDAFRSSFRPPAPVKNQAGSDWIVSGVWSDYMRAWLARTFVRRVLEHPPRLDAALWFDSSKDCMDIALEWEWDNSKVYEMFPTGDFLKVLRVDARCGLAIVQTRADGRKNGGRGTKRADQTLARIRQSHIENRIDARPVGLVEIRRTFRDASRVTFVWSYLDLNLGITTEGESWTFP